MSKKLGKLLPPVEKIMAIRFLLLDVDGVMTDGSICYTSSGEEMKCFNVKDGAGLKYWSRAGHAAGIITGRSSEIVLRRARELDIGFVEMDAKNKLPALVHMMEASGVRASEIAMIGDDLPDLPLISRAGLGIAVADAVDEVKDAADLVTNKKGGRGAVREVIDYILKIQGRWDGVMQRYRDAM